MSSITSADAPPPLSTPIPTPTPPITTPSITTSNAVTTAESSTTSTTSPPAGPSTTTTTNPPVESSTTTSNAPSSPQPSSLPPSVPASPPPSSAPPSITTTSDSSTNTSTTGTSDAQTTLPPSATSPTAATSSRQTTLSTQVLTTTNAAGQTFTSTFTNVVTAGSSATSSAAASTHTSTPFFQNKAAVAGTFSAVGLVALILLAVLATAAIRRRRARKFDDEVEEAAAEAAKTSDRAYLDDDDAYSGPGGGASLHTAGYSDATHGTFGQPPLAVESYGMRELPPGGYHDYGHVPATAAEYGAEYGTAGVGAGVGAVAMQRAKSLRDPGAPQGVAPYNAFAGPQYDAQAPYDAHTPYSAFSPGSGDPYKAARQTDLLDAAGLGAGASLASNPSRRSAAVAAQQRGVALGRSPSQVPTVHHSGGLHRNKSITLEQDFIDPAAPPLPKGAGAPLGLVRSKSGAAQAQAPPPQESYADRYLPDGASALSRNKSTHSRAPTTPSRPSSMLDPYSAYQAHTPEPMPVPLHGVDLLGGQRSSRVMSYGTDSDDDDSPGSRAHDEQRESRATFRDDEDYGYGGARVLRVANE